MRTRRVTQWVLVAVLTGLLVAGGLATAIFQQSLAAAAGLTRSGAPTTIAPSVFEPSQALEGSAQPPAAGTGVIGAAELPGDAPMPEREELEKKLAALDTSKLVGVDDAPVQLAYQVIDVVSGEVVAAKDDTTALIPASNTKTLTTLAVMNAFTGAERFATRVLQPAPGQLVLVGGGDPLLVSEPVAEGAYPSPASTRELAVSTAQALAEAGQTSVTLGYDASYFEEPGWNETWPANYRDQVTQLSALWVDEGRLPEGGRSRDPARAAAATFAAQLAEEGITVTGTPEPAAAEGEEVARVESLPVHVLVETAMTRSNNSFTEVLGLQLAQLTGHPTTFAGAVAAIEEELTSLGVWDSGTVLRDSSGLSRSNRLTAHMLAQAMTLFDGQARLSVILDGLPTAGVTGTLAERFTDDVARNARGVARAKTGTLSLVSTLAGTTLTADGRLLAFAFMINGAPDGWAAKVWTDQATGVVASCGC